MTEGAALEAFSMASLETEADLGTATVRQFITDVLFGNDDNQKLYLSCERYPFSVTPSPVTLDQNQNF